MYSSLQNQLFNLIHYAISFLLLVVIYPLIIAKREYDTGLEELVSNYILMVLVIILMGYLLVIIKLYEFLGIFIFLLALYMYLKVFKSPEAKMNKRKMKIHLLIFDYLDNVRSIREDAKNLFSQGIKKFFKVVYGKLSNKADVLNLILLIAVLLFSAYLRFYDSFINAAPAMSDSYVTLKWMKAIINRQLFVDGIYPQGFHIYMATLQKFAFIDPLYILRYSGPLDGVLITFGIYFVVSRITKSKASGIIGAVIYGILAAVLLGPSIAERQAATNSQEFGYVFVIPTLYFFSRYIVTNKKRDFITGFAGTAVAGLVHTISFAFISIGVFIMLFISMLVDVKKYWKNIYRIVLAGIASGLIAVIPVEIGFLMGKGFNSSSESFLTESSNSIAFPALSVMDKAGIASIGIVLIYLLINYKHIKEKLPLVYMVFINAAAFVVYYAGGYVTKSVVFATRMTDFWTLTEPVVIGMAFYCFISIFKRVTFKNTVAFVGASCFAIVSVFYFTPAPIIPYKMEYNSNVEQYLRISKMLNPTEWMIVSQDEDYAIVWGKGYHMLISDFLQYYDPEFNNPNNPYLFYKKDNTYTKTQDIFLFEEKKVFTTQFTDLIDYPLRSKEDKELQQWVDKYKQKHSNLSIFYEDANIVVYRIHQGGSRDETMDKIWGQ